MKAEIQRLKAIITASILVSLVSFVQYDVIQPSYNLSIKSDIEQGGAKALLSEDIHKKEEQVSNLNSTVNLGMQGCL